MPAQARAASVSSLQSPEYDEPQEHEHDPESVDEVDPDRHTLAAQTVDHAPGSLQDMRDAEAYDDREKRHHIGKTVHARKVNAPEQVNDSTPIWQNNHRADTTTLHPCGTRNSVNLDPACSSRRAMKTIAAITFVACQAAEVGSSTERVARVKDIVTRSACSTGVKHLLYDMQPDGLGPGVKNSRTRRSGERLCRKGQAASCPGTGRRSLGPRQ